MLWHFEGLRPIILATLRGLIGKLSADTDSVFLRGCNNLMIPPAGGVLGSDPKAIESDFSILGEILFALDRLVIVVDVVARGEVFLVVGSSAINKQFLAFIKA